MYLNGLLNDLAKKETCLQLTRTLNIGKRINANRIYIQDIFKNNPLYRSIDKSINQSIDHFRNWETTLTIVFAFRYLMKGLYVLIWALQNVVCILYIFKIDGDIKHLNNFLFSNKILDNSVNSEGPKMLDHILE